MGLVTEAFSSFTPTMFFGIAITCVSPQAPLITGSLNAICFSPRQQLAFIDFWAFIQFPDISPNHYIPCRSTGTSEPFRSNEQDQEETFDIFAADVYGLRQILIYELVLVLVLTLCYRVVHCS